MNVLKACLTNNERVHHASSQQHTRHAVHSGVLYRYFTRDRTGTGMAVLASILVEEPVSGRFKNPSRRPYDEKEWYALPRRAIGCACPAPGAKARCVHT